jgi:spermidine synthase
MTSTPALEATVPPRPVASGWRVPLVLYALTGFSGLLAEQGFEKYLQLLVGATASASAAVLFAYFLGFALGGVAAAGLIRKGRIGRPLAAYGMVELAAGMACIVFSYCFHPLMGALAPLQNLFAGPALKFQVRFFCGCLLVLPAAALMGASFPLIAQALDNTQSAIRKRWSQAYAANLAGALAASVAAPFLIMPAIGLRGALWICCAIGAVICSVTAILPHAPPAPVEAAATARQPLTHDVRLLLVASFGSGAIFFALEVIWTHLIGVALGSSVYAFSWMLAAVLLGLLAGAVLVNRTAKTGRPIRTSLLFQCAALLLTAQLSFWDRVPGLFRFTPPGVFQNSFYFAEIFKLCLAILLLAPPAAVLGLIYPRLLSSEQLRGERNAHLSGYLSAANALGCLSGALLGIFVLVPLAGSEVSLKVLVLVLALFWVLFLLREPVPPKRLATAAVTAAILLAVLLGRWWNWGTLTAGLGDFFGQATIHAAGAPQQNVRYLPAAFLFKQEDVQGGFTTVVEQTVVTGEVGHTVRTLFTNGTFQGDDNQIWGGTQAQLGFSAVPSLFVSDYGRALLIGLGTGQSAAALKHLGYREIVVAEFAPGIVKAAEKCFSGLNEGIVGDPRVRLCLEDGRNVLLTGQRRQYDLIAIELTSIWFAGATNLYSREFYELAHSRLRPGGVLQEWVQLHHIGPREIASELATASSVFPYVGLWYYGDQGMLVAADHPLTGPRLQTGLAPEEAATLVESIAAARLLDPDGVARLVAGRHPPINTDHNRWIEYATPQYQSSSYDWVTHNLRFLRQYR